MTEAGVNFIGEAQYADGLGWQHFPLSRRHDLGDQRSCRRALS